MTTGDISFHALRFGRAAQLYEAGAQIQGRMAGALIDLWEARPAPANILEFGCGTGLLTRALRARFPGTPLLATDASAGMLEVARLRLPGAEHPILVEQDAQGRTPPAAALLERAPFALIASGALVQWFPDLAAHLRFAASLAAPRGHYLVSGFARDNFPELNALLSKPPFDYRNFPGHNPDGVESAAAQAGWDVSALYAWEEKEILPSPREVLGRLQNLGSVRDPREGGRMNRANLQFLLKEYGERFADAGGVRLTWRAWAALLRRA